MKVFISWSGDTSKALAEALRSWLPSVIQAIKPYFSPDDISKGSRWSNEISKELEECKIGLICLTAQNLEAPWVMFETGALSKSIAAARVCPLLFGIEPSDVKGPLVQFQAASFARDEMKKAVKMMNQELASQALPADVLDSVFDMWWPKLEEKVAEIMANVDVSATKNIRDERDILEEILARVRAVPLSTSQARIHPGAIQHLNETHERLSLEVSQLPIEYRSALVDIVDDLRRPIDYINTRLDFDGELTPQLRRGLPERVRVESAKAEITKATKQKNEPLKKIKIKRTVI